MVDVAASAIPRHDADVERAILGAPLRDDGPADALALVLAKTRPDHFYLEKNRIIRQWMQTLAAAGDRVDVLTLGAAMRDAGALDVIGRDYLALLFESGAIPAHIETYIRVLHQCWRSRRMEQLARALIDLNGAGPERGVAEIRQALDELAAPHVPLFVPLTGVEILERRYTIDPIAAEDETTGMFAHGDSGKSMLAALLALTCATGQTLIGAFRPAGPRRVLVLDWETSQSTWNDRVGKLAAGCGVDVPESMILYREMTEPLLPMLDAIAAEARAADVGLVVVDSLAPAIGQGATEGDAVIPTMTALRRLAPAARLVLAHVSWSEAEKATARMYGSVFGHNLTRSIWELRRDGEDEAGLALTLTHRKHNNTPTAHTPIGIRLAGTPAGHLRPEYLDPATVARVATGGSKMHRVRTTLSALKAASIEELHEHLGDIERDLIRRYLQRLRDAGKAAELPDGQWRLK